MELGWFTITEEVILGVLMMHKEVNAGDYLRIFC